MSVLLNAERSARPDPHSPLSPYHRRLRWGVPGPVAAHAVRKGRSGWTWVHGRLMRLIAARKREEAYAIKRERERLRKLQREEDLLVCAEEFLDIIHAGKD